MRRLLRVLGVTGLVLMAFPLMVEPAAADSAVNTAGTSFLTAAPIDTAKPVSVAASTGDYLYWSFDATAGQTNTVSVAVTLPPQADRHGAQVWAVDVFDGLRRRQSCTAGAQAPVAAPADATVRMECTLREVRSWAEPWSGDPLPGLYYVRVSASELPEQDQGLPVKVDLKLASTDSGDPAPEGGDLRAPLAPPDRPGAVQSPAPNPTASPAPDEDDDLVSFDWWPGATSRWTWTVVGAVLAAVAGVLGYTLARRRRL
ncbi:hypothetical protein Val02_48310 [Virgisporangium aliadipatigenens]|uniref:Peptidase n=1 Tax=Virgisporangium aliadipatigenens TaxID=741659 RepID=A0A8J3YQ56_9ACTN|nr:peptidase [Virgisporangium aliadipatigenens]GIJ47945.1 hypothetical protein Val02_48310 [Virgisporangium aliadipatigenens]